MYRQRRSTRSRFLWGVVLLVIGIVTLLANLGVYIPADFWEFWPAIPFTIGAILMLWPGPARERLGGFWMLSIGIYGFISQFQLFGLHYGTSWPVLIVALGVYVVLSGVFREDKPKSSTDSNNSGGTLS